MLDFKTITKKIKNYVSLKIETIKHMTINDIILFLKRNAYLFLFFIAFLFLDFSFRSFFLLFSLHSFLETPLVLFDLFWAIIFTLFLYIIPKKLWKRIYTIFLSLLFGILCVAQSVYFSLFYKFFGLQDASLLSEGTQFADTSYFEFHPAIIQTVIIFTFIILAVLYFIPKQPSRKKAPTIVLVLVSVSLYGLARNSLPERTAPDLWDAAINPANIYHDFNDSSQAMSVSGFYEYTFRDLFLTINPIKKMQEHQITASLDEVFETYTVEHEDNEKTGLYKDKNVMLIQLENIDTWMLTEENMPALYYMMSTGTNFVNHYSPAFATGRTFNTEFIVNTGLIPPSNGKAPGYIYSSNTYPFSLANKFKEQEYAMNSFHGSSGTIYNRAKVHNTFGYDVYHDWSMMEMEDLTMDSQMINGFESMVASDKFFDFIITYSGHGPFNTDVAACSANYDTVSEYASINDDVYKCGLAQAKETDILMESLLKRLYEEDLLEDTVFVLYTDHYTYGLLSEEMEIQLKGTTDTNLLQQTPFIIWNYNQEPETVMTYSSTVDIAPTLMNLFGIDVDYKYFIGTDLFSTDDNDVYFADRSIINDTGYYPAQDVDEYTDTIKEKFSIVNEKLNRSWNILTTDYYKKFENQNKK